MIRCTSSFRRWMLSSEARHVGTGRSRRRRGRRPADCSRRPRAAPSPSGSTRRSCRRGARSSAGDAARSTWVPSVSTFLSPIASTIGFFPAVCALVRIERVRLAQHLLEIGLVDLVGEDGRALGDERPQAAGMIDVAVGVDHVPDRLVRNQPLGFGDDRQRARLVLAAFDQRDVILEVDGDAPRSRR